MKGERRKSRMVRAGTLEIGGDAPVSVQSMTSVPIEDVEGTIRQIRRLEEAGAQLVRLALRNEEALEYLKKIRCEVDMPLSADVHFNHRIALGAIGAGIDKIRINPGNIGSGERVREIVRAARERGVPIRIGVNGGSLDRRRYREVTPENLVSSAMDHVRVLEDQDYRDIVVSIKSSDIDQTIAANRIFSEGAPYPLHIGLTEAGYGISCVVQSSIAIGTLLMEGIGDTVRVSMTGDPVEEVRVAVKILESAGHRKPLIRLIACPTCGRTDPSLDLPELAARVEREITGEFGEALKNRGRGLTVAVMGCEVNGPGEASHADAGIAGGRGGKMLLFSRGRKLKTIRVEDALPALKDEIGRMLSEEE